MFSGIISEIGQVKKVVKKDKLLTLSIASLFSSKLSLGESICINGVCLTVTNVNSNQFSVELSPTTLNITNFKNIKEESFVNLERSLQLSDRLSGHIVSGHIDGTAPLIQCHHTPSQTLITLKMDSQQEMFYFIPKGSITVNGVSLTIVNINEKCIDITIIPHTFKHTTFQYLKIGDTCNIEVDLMGKYIESILSAWKSKM